MKDISQIEGMETRTVKTSRTSRTSRTLSSTNIEITVNIMLAACLLVMFFGMIWGLHFIN